MGAGCSTGRRAADRNTARETAALEAVLCGKAVAVAAAAGTVIAPPSV